MRRLTLKLEPEVIDLARKVAEAQGTSISSLFARTIRFIAQGKGQRSPVGQLTRKASGLVKLSRNKSAREIIEDTLLEKHKLA